MENTKQREEKLGIVINPIQSDVSINMSANTTPTCQMTDVGHVSANTLVLCYMTGRWTVVSQWHVSYMPADALFGSNSLQYPGKLYTLMEYRKQWKLFVKGKRLST